MAAPNKVDSNSTGLAICEEAAPKVLPATPIWQEMEPNSYSDFGASYTNVARTPINDSRQVKKGVTTDVDASGGFASDFTQTNMQNLLQGFFFADAREKPTTKPLNSAAIPVTAVTGSSKTYTAAVGSGIYLPGHLILASNFGVAANNGLDKVASSTATTIVGTAIKADEASPSTAAKIEVVGFEFATADITFTLTGGILRMASAAVTMTTLGLTPGEWIFIGGDATVNQPVKPVNVGYARVSTIAAGYVEFNETTFAAESDTTIAKALRIFFGRVVKNEISTLIKRRSYQLERKLGNDGDDIQSELLIGAFANEFKITVPQAEKLTTDLSFVAMGYETRSGTDGIKAGTRVTPAIEDAYNTSNDVYRMKMSIVSPSSINNSALFAYVTDCNISINNGVTPNKAIGVLGAFDTSAGNFVVSGSLTAYFSTVAATNAIKNNSDVAFNAIFARENAGFVFDIPLMAIGGGRLNVEKDNSITLPIEMSASENTLGHTAAMTFFSYLPTVAMPV